MTKKLFCRLFIPLYVAIALLIGLSITSLYIKHRAVDTAEDGVTITAGSSVPMGVIFGVNGERPNYEVALHAKNAMPPSFKPPVDKIKIGLFTYSIVYRDKEVMPGVYGITFSVQKVIAINADFTTTKEELANTMLHEMFHACDYIGNGESTEGEQVTIKAVTPTLVQAMRDNPELMHWMLTK